jgi:hypothetical protein
MNEMDVLTRFRAEVPAGEVSPLAEHRFMFALQSPGRAGQLRLGTRIPRLATKARLARRPRLAWSALAGAAAVGAATVALATLPSANPPALRTQTHPGPESAARPLTVQELAYRAASAALAGPDVKPGQWIFRKWLVTGHILEAWQTADTSQSAWYTAGKLIRASDPVTVPVSYTQLRSLPADPFALDRYLVSLAGKYATSPAIRIQIAFSWAGSLFENFVLPPRQGAELFHALADLPGVTIADDVADSAGAHGVAFVLRSGPAEDELILSETGYKVIGGRLALTGQSGTHAKDWSLLAQALVSAPGVRP